MFLEISKVVLICFGIFFNIVGVFMLVEPERIRGIIRKAGSTCIINYGEISLRMIPAASLVIYSDNSKFPMVFFYVGSFMLFTSFVLFFVPMKIHHAFSSASADRLLPSYIRVLSPISIGIGGLLIYSLYP